MKDKIVKLIIDSLSRSDSYNIVEFKYNENKRTIWGLSKGEGSNAETLIFCDSSNIDIIDKKYIKVLLVEENDDLRKYIDDNNNEKLIIIDYSNNKITYYSSGTEYIAQRIASILFENIQRSTNKYLPWATYIIIAINVVVYLITAFASKNIVNIHWKVLRYFGAKDNMLIYSGEYYRLFTCMFLHGGIIHLSLNMYALYALGPMVEKVYGRSRYVVIYLVSGIVSSIFSLIFSKGMSVGASGAIFGLLSAILVVTFSIKTSGSKELMKNILTVIIINLFIGLALPNIDNYGHLGGLIGGIIISFILKSKLYKVK